MLSLDALDFRTLLGNRIGLEREMLRVGADHRVATTLHPAALGHKLSHPQITVDFSEGLLELVTAPHATRRAMLHELAELHAFVARSLDHHERLWSLSMPPSVRSEEILIGDFGSSHSGRMKQVYRQGLANRYGKIMQVIAGVHYNFSFDTAFIAHMHELMGRGLSPEECRNRLYFRLIRGFDRLAWLLPYLFGASPIAAATSNGLAADWLQSFDDEHVIGEFATSLRMSEIGYQSPAQADLNISHACLNDYVRGLVDATRTPWPAYQRLGRQRDGQWLQLSGNILQIENEYYSAIRPKQSVELGERPACALHSRGVEYIEVRLLDVDPFSATGISQQTADFLEIFLLACLRQEAQAGEDAAADQANLRASITRGREPGLQLSRPEGRIALADWAQECLGECLELAQRMDQAAGSQAYANAVQAQLAKLADPALLPSQRVIDAAQAEGYGRWAIARCEEHSAQLAAAPLLAERLESLVAQARHSFAAAAQIEAQQSGSFDEYVQSYFDSLCEQSSAELGLIAAEAAPTRAFL